MSSNKKISRPPSLSQHFDAPEGYIGHFGWLCGYSADALFLNDATERFTQLTRATRANQGRIALALLLDPGNPPISLLDSPGVAHLPIIDLVNRPFRLLHAKVALLGFRHQKTSSQWKLRLLVSTGNWTRQTLEESLDLMWRIDFDSESLNNLNTGTKQDCADIKGSWNLLLWIQKFFDTRLLNASAHHSISETMNARLQVSEWIERCADKAQGRPRVFDNRSKSLLSQLAQKIKTNREVKRNYLAIGSGFYETSNDPQKPPEVPLAILKTLREENLLTGKPVVDLYVNPMACQAIATSLKPLQTHGFTIRPAAIPATVFGEIAQRNLHAKFLFSANYRDNANACSNAWVYLGSGNMTHPGFAKKMSPFDGNLEVGVVFPPSSLFWQEDEAYPGLPVVTNMIPIQWEDEISDIALLSAGPSIEKRDADYLAPPIAWFAWHKTDSASELRTDDSRVADVEVLDSSGVSCSRTEKGFQWDEAQPRQVLVRWQTYEALIPVVDQYGRIAATTLPAIDIDAAWWQLADFPISPNEDEEDIRGEDIENRGNQQKPPVSNVNYPIRQMMILIESIAAKQTEIDEMDWVFWCTRLEQTLGQAADSAPVKYFRDDVKLNPLSPLRQCSFRPSFAETNDSTLGELYNKMLNRIEESWKVNELSQIGRGK